MCLCCGEFPLGEDDAAEHGRQGPHHVFLEVFEQVLVCAKCNKSKGDGRSCAVGVVLEAIPEKLDSLMVSLDEWLEQNDPTGLLKKEESATWVVA